MSTIFSIVESVRQYQDGGDSPNAASRDFGEVRIAVIQVINSLIKSQHLTEEMAGGEQIPDGTILTEYDNVPVESYKGVSRATLPIMPVKIGSRGVGCFHVSKTDDIINGFIPFKPGELQMIGEENLISDILGQVGYENRGKYLVFNRDITDNSTEEAITEVYCLLAVKDISLYTDWEMLPISSDMEAAVIQGTLQYLSNQQPANKKVDVINKQEVKQ